MKIVWKSLLKFLVGIIFGVIAIFLFTDNNEIIFFWEHIVGIQRPDMISLRFSGILPFAVYLLISVLVVLIFTYILRYFANSKNVKKRAAILNIVIQIFIGIPLATMLYAFLEPLLMKSGLDAVILTILSAILYAVLYFAISTFFEQAFYEKLKKEHKRCKLIVCYVTGSSGYEETEIIVKNMTFEDCYSAMKNNRDRLGNRQFFKIQEMNWNGKKEVESWRYYHTGDIITDTDEQLCQSLMRAVEAQNIQWQG